MYKHVCIKCGKEFFNKKQNTLFCSRECYNNYEHLGELQNKKKNLIKVQCAECGKIEYVYPSRAKKYVCCSIDCLIKYKSKLLSQRITLVCPICGEKYECQKSKISHHRTCGKKSCSSAWRSMTRKGKGNSNYKNVEDLLKEKGVSSQDPKKIYKYNTLCRHIVKDILGLDSACAIPKGYVVHHKDANHFNNDPENLIVLPKNAHMLVHKIFGNVLINALHTGKIDRDLFFKMCNEEQRNFYKEIIDLNVKDQVVVKQGELLETHEDGNQQPSIYRNIIEGSTTNERVLTDNTEDGNFNTSALPDYNIGDDIV